MHDPNSWSPAMETLKVGDPFTEEWLDRFRRLMIAYNEARAALMWIADNGPDDAYELREAARRSLHVQDRV